MARHQNIEKGEPVHLGHLNIERDYLWFEGADLVVGIKGICSGAHYADIRMLIESAFQEAPDNGRVVYNENPNWWCARAARLHGIRW